MFIFKNRSVHSLSLRSARWDEDTFADALINTQLGHHGGTEEAGALPRLRQREEGRRQGAPAERGRREALHG